MPSPDEITIALLGDVMLGRGIEQILPHPHPSDPLAYGFVQLPAYSKLRGDQLFPRWTASAGLGYHCGDRRIGLGTRGQPIGSGERTFTFQLRTAAKRETAAR
jgi:hypothetical protein